MFLLSEKKEKGKTGEEELVEWFVWLKEDIEHLCF
jgi:hypothetical protein